MKADHFIPDAGDYAGSPATVLDAILEHAKRSAAAIAVLAADHDPVTYDELGRSVQATAERLDALGLRQSDRVAVIAGNDPAGVVLLLSLISRVVCCPVNGAWSAAEITAYLGTLRASAMVISGEVSAHVREAAAASGVPVVLAAPDPRIQLGLRLDAEGAARRTPAPTAGPDGDEVLMLRTSGTTSAGKIVPLSMANIMAAASASVHAYRLTADDRRLNVMPLFHVQGLVGSVITSLLAGSSVVCLPVFEPESVLASLIAYQPTWLSATPTMHQALLDHGSSSFRPPTSLRFIRCGAGALPAALRAAMEARYGVPVIESYGMSEAHQIASTPLPPDRARGMVPTISRIGLLDEYGGIHTEPGSSGEIVVSGPNVITRYAWPPGSDANFVNGWLRTGDLGSLADDGSLIITGRIKEIINCGGEKFSPHEIEEVLLRHPAVSQAVAFAVPDPALVERAGAVVVLSPGAQVTEQELTAFTASQLARYKVPKRILPRIEIPAGPSGKVVRSTLAAVLGDELNERPAGSDRRGPRDTVEAILTGLWTLALKRDTVAIDDDFLAIGGDSLTAISLLMMVDEAFSVRLSPLILFDEANTVESMAAVIRSARESGTISQPTGQ
jgi:acyl-CoA synthetase (AMP-forming)/AMP-acid ligase II/acyl carrier protein